MQNKPVWKHRKLDKSEVRHDPTESEHFKSGAPSEALEREDTQNRLDRKDPQKKGKPVVIRYTFSGEEFSLEKERAEYYLGDLKKHLVKSELTALEEKNMDFLVIEGFHTLGLGGDPAQAYDDPEDSGSKNDFYYFFRNVGRSIKAGNDRGRWGLGKNVYPGSSEIKTFWGYTVRKSDGRRYLMGQSVLKTHQIDDELYSPYGYHGYFKEEKHPYFATPVDDEGYLDEFKNDFLLLREGQPGLSLVIPYPIDELNPEAIAKSLVRHYFYPLIAGSLRVEIAKGQENVFSSLDSKTLAHEIEKLPWDSGENTSSKLKELVEFATWCIGREESDFITIDKDFLPGQNEMAKWDDEWIHAENREAYRKSYDEGERLAFRIPVAIHHKKDELKASYFDVFVERAPDLKHGDEHYIRQGLTISSIKKLRGKGVRTILVADDDPVSRLLGDSENPAHTLWSSRSDRLKNYHLGPSTVSFISSAAQSIVQMLSRPSEKKYEELLIDIFNISTNSNESGDPKTGPGAGGEPSEKPSIPTPDLPPRIQPFVISPIDGGISISLKEGLKEVPAEARVRLAYSIRKGNAFGKYHLEDFSFLRGTLEVRGKGASVDIEDHNALIFRTSGPEFRIRVTGFDKNRDLEIDLTILR